MRKDVLYKLLKKSSFVILVTQGELSAVISSSRSDSKYVVELAYKKIGPVVIFRVCSLCEVSVLDPGIMALSARVFKILKTYPEVIKVAR